MPVCWIILLQEETQTSPPPFSILAASAEVQTPQEFLELLLSRTACVSLCAVDCSWSRTELIAQSLLKQCAGMWFM